MDKAKTPTIPVRGYAPNKKALGRLIAAGIPAIKVYEADKGQTWDKFKMRDGEYLGVVDGFSAFGTGKRAIHQAVEQFHGHGATILDVETGQDSRTHGVTMFDEATKPRKPSAEFTKLMQDEKAEARRKSSGQMAKREAYAIWTNPKLSTEEKVEATRWSRAALYAEFGKSGAPAGRRAKTFVPTPAELPEKPKKVRLPRSMQGFVYFMRINGRGHVKIGYAQDIGKRLSGHGVSTPGTPILVGWMHGTRATEKQLHKKYDALRVKGEWFKYASPLKDFVESLPEPVK